MKILYLCLSLCVFSIPLQGADASVASHRPNTSSVLVKRQTTGKQRSGKKRAKKARAAADGANANVNAIRGAGKGIAAAQARVGESVQIVEGIVQPSANSSLSLQYRVAIPANNGTATQGVNVLLHGDGGSSFFAFPNAQLRDDLIGVALLAPNAEMRWGGSDDVRSSGPEHVQLVRDFIVSTLPQMVTFDRSKVFFTGVSGGALTLTSAMLPIFGDEFPSGMLLLCGGIPPQQAIPEGKLAPTMRLHFQSTTDELPPIKTEIPDTIRAITQASQALLSTEQINSQFTVDGTPQGGHCVFDGQGFNSGVQLMVDHFGDIMLRNQAIPGVTAPQLRGIMELPNPF
jgi:predicted esterase